MTRGLFSAEDRELLRELYPDTPTKALAERMGRSTSSVHALASRMGVAKSPEYLAGPDACRLRRGDHVGMGTRFASGHTPHNKDKRRPGYAPGRMAETQFKRGQRSGLAAKNWRPIGTILADSEGYLRIKVREAAPGEAYGFGNVLVWPLVQRHVWEQHHGPIPAGHKIIFKDGDRKNTAIENLECISAADLLKRNSIHNLPKELMQVIQLSGALKRQLRKHEKQTGRSA